MAEICVVHLVRARNGLEPFERFLHCYTEHPPGIDHDLVLVYKGFHDAAAPAEFRRVASCVQHRSFFVTDWGFDLRPYGIVARLLTHRYFCFLNSFSEPLDAGWGEKLYHSLRQTGVGLVGATGSWESMYSNLLLANRKQETRTLTELFWRPIRIRLCERFFEKYPNWHLRTNAILLGRDIILRCWPSLVATKRSAYLFESGKNSLTYQVLRMGLDVKVVGKDGQSYAKEEWPKSRTYRSGRQENLLVADRQTRFFERADLNLRRQLAISAWGEQVDLDALQ